MGDVCAALYGIAELFTNIKNVVVCDCPTPSLGHVACGKRTIQDFVCSLCFMDSWGVVCVGGSLLYIRLAHDNFNPQHSQFTLHTLIQTQTSLFLLSARREYFGIFFLPFVLSKCCLFSLPSCVLVCIHTCVHTHITLSCTSAHCMTLCSFRTIRWHLILLPFLILLQLFILHQLHP